VDQNADRDRSAEARARERLDTLRVPYRLLSIDPEYADTAQCCERYGLSLEASVNCILVASKGEPRRHAICLAQATRRLDVNHTVRQLLGVSRVSFASAEETVARTGMIVGGVTPFGLPDDLPVYVDAPIMALEEMIVGGGGRSSKIIVPPAALEGLPNVKVVEGLANPRPVT
jgi:prolyl-tRNA editing enzyme YbaK/EbsC (Cys-tRNA(Pro) deacylase)